MNNQHIKFIVSRVLILIVLVLLLGVLYLTTNKTPKVEILSTTGTSTVQITDASIKTEVVKPFLLKVISPNGGEQWEIGKTYTVTITSKGDLGRKLIRLNKYSDDGIRLSEKVIGIIDDRFATSTFSFTVSTSTEISKSGADYKIQVVADKYNSALGVSDESDVPFSIIQKTSSITK